MSIRLAALVPLLGFAIACTDPTGLTNVEAPVVEAVPTTGEWLLLVGEYSREDGDDDGFYLVDAATGDLRFWELDGEALVDPNGLVCYGPGGTDWSAARQELLFAGDLACERGIYVIGADGGVRSVAAGDMSSGVLGDARGHTWPETGDLIAMTADTWNTTDEWLGEELFVLDEGSGSLTQITFESAQGRVVSPTFSPDGSTIAYLFQDSLEQMSLHWIDAAGAGESQLLAGPDRIMSDAHALQWSPDGSTLALLQSASEPGTGGADEAFFGVWLYDIAGGTLTELLPTRPADAVQGVHRFAWSPSGDRLALDAGFNADCWEEGFTGILNCSAHLYTIGTDGEGLTQVTEAPHASTAHLLWVR